MPRVKRIAKKIRYNRKKCDLVDGSARAGHPCRLGEYRPHDITLGRMADKVEPLSRYRKS